MSASDSDYSIDWLASDDDTDTDAGSDRSSNPDPPQRPEDDRGGGPDRSSNPSPGRPDASQPPPTSTTTTCLQDPPRNHQRLLLSAGSVDIKSDDNDDGDCKDARRLNTRECSENSSSSGGDSSSDCSSPVFLSKQNFWTGPVQGYYTTCCAGQHVPSSRGLSTTSASGVSSGMQKRGLHSPVGHCEPSRAEDTTDKELFSRKCMELQCYIQPLSSILRGLRSGRYSQRLSSFQESVAMDRIQRIMGVLQNPHMGERFMNIVLKMEAMLHSWFPQVKRRSADQDTADSVTPAKRQKSSSSSPWSVRPASSGVAAGAVPGPFSAALQLRWSHDTSLKTSELPPSALRTATAADAAATAHQVRGSAGSGVLLLQATQDNVVSSSTDLQNGPAKKSKQPPHPPRGGRRGAPPPLPFKISSPCLQRLLQATESIIAPRTVGDDDRTACERSDL